MSTCLPTGRKDLSIFKANFSLLNKFLMNSTPCFTKKQMAVFVLVIYALFKDYKRNSLETMAKSSNINYQKLQCFMSDSKWDMQAIKQKRLEIIQKRRATASTKDGLIGIDDTESITVKVSICQVVKRDITDVFLLTLMIVFTKLLLICEWCLRGMITNWTFVNIVYGYSGLMMYVQTACFLYA